MAPRQDMADSGSPQRGSPDVLAMALARGCTVADAAVLASMSERSAYRRLADPGFRQHVRDTRNAMVERSIAKLAGMTDAAAERLRELLASKSEKIALGAIKAVYEMFRDGRQDTEFDERLKAVEEKHGVRNATPPARKR